MIDYTKIRICGINLKRLENLPYLDFKRICSESTGEMSTKKIAKYHFCTITINDSGVVMFAGSIHKMYNSLKGINSPNRKFLTAEQIKKGIIDTYSGFNGNQFNIDNIFWIIGHLQTLFECTQEQMIFQNIEFGVNLSTSFDPKLFIKGLLYQQGQPFEFRFKNNYAQAVHQRYILKIYNKSYQYGISENVLRVEVKIKKSEELKELVIKSFADISECTLRNAEELLLQRFDEVVYYDYTIQKKKLTQKNKALLKDYSRPLYWLDDIKPNHRDREKKRLHNFIVKNSDNLHLGIRQDIIQKCVINNRLPEHPKCVIINSSSIGVNSTQKHSSNTLKKQTKICPITKVDISMQKTDSFLLSNAGLKYIEKHDKKLFDFIANVFLTGNENKYEKDIHSRISKQIRNKYFSNRGLYSENQNRLF